jgi:hypothetical protein
VNTRRGAGARSAGRPPRRPAVGTGSPRTRCPSQTWLRARRALPTCRRRCTTSHRRGTDRTHRPRRTPRRKTYSSGCRHLTRRRAGPGTGRAGEPPPGAVGRACRVGTTSSSARAAKNPCDACAASELLLAEVAHRPARCTLWAGDQGLLAEVRASVRPAVAAVRRAGAPGTRRGRTAASPATARPPGPRGSSCGACSDGGTAPRTPRHRHWRPRCPRRPPAPPPRP